MIPGIAFGMKRLIFILCLTMGLAGIARAEPGQIAPGFDGPVPAGHGRIIRDGVLLTMPQERRAEAIGYRLRCLVCQNESVEISQAALAQQFRAIIRKRVAAGESDRRIIDFMVRRYGIFILLKPPLIPATWVLWFSPLIALVCGLLVLLFARRRRRDAPPPLSAAEEARLRELT